MGSTTYIITITAGAAGPLVLESSGCFYFILFYFFTTNFFPIHQFFNFTTIFTTNVYHRFYHTVYHKLLPLTTIIIGVSISTTTPIFFSNPTIFQFYHTFYYTCYHNFYHKPLPLSPQTPHNVFCT